MRALRLLSSALGLLSLSGVVSGLTTFGMKNQTYNAWLYTYPILATYKTFYQEMIAPGNPVFNQFKIQELPTPQTPGPNPSVDTLSAVAWVDLRDQPMVLRVPKYPERYWVVQTTHLKGYDAAYVGTRSAYDAAKGDYIMFGPANRYKTDPGGLFKDLLWCDSDWARVKLSVYVNGPEDVPAAKQMLQSFQLVGLKEFLEPQAGVTFKRVKPQPPVIKDWPVWNDNYLKDGDHVLDFLPFLNWMAPHLKFALGNESKFIEECHDLGVNVTKPWVASDYEGYQLQAMKEGAQAAYDFVFNNPGIEAKYPLGSDKLSANDWSSNDFKKHAVRVAQSGPFLPMLWESEQIVKDFPNAQPGESHTLRFEGDKIPMTNNAAFGFWAITVYSLPDRKLVDNPANKYQLNSRNPDFNKWLKNGALEIYLQSDNPGPDKEATWLPTPKGPFGYVVRIYAPAGNVMPVTKDDVVIDPATFAPVQVKELNNGTRRMLLRQH